jgi:hypothetical protein
MNEIARRLKESVTRMARRDAAGHLIVASQMLCVRVYTSVVACPWCSGTIDDAEIRDAVPYYGWEPGWDWAPNENGRPTLRVLACEIITARSLLALAAAINRFRDLGEAQFRTRAVTLADSGLDPRGDHALPQIIDAVDTAEHWFDLVEEGRAPAAGIQLTLPTATRRQWPGKGLGMLDAATRYRAFASPHFITPHADGPATSALNTLYLEQRLATVAKELKLPA